jgi:DNA-binding transcriptional MerR regulator
MEDGLLIGEVAKRVGVTTKTIRYYESMGLVSEARRTDSGYRVYSGEDVDRIRFIQGAKALGLSLHEIKDIVGIWSEGARPCWHVSRLIDAKLADLDHRIEELSRFRHELRRYKEQVDASAESDTGVPCAHIEGINTGKWSPPALDTRDRFHSKHG